MFAIDVFTKFEWVKLFKDKKSKTFHNGFIKIVNESNFKAYKLSDDQRRELYNKPMQESLNNNDVLMYSTHHERNSVIAERFIKNLKAKIYKKIRANVSKSYLAY